MWVKWAVALQFLFPVSLSVKSLLKRADGESSIQPVTWFCVQRLEAGTKWKSIQSRGYPKVLVVKDSRCTWRLQAAKGKRVQIAFRGIDLDADDPAHCSSNYIEVVDEVIGKSQAKFCGKNTPGDIISQGRKLRIDFQAQPGKNAMSGFMISFKASTGKPGFYAKKSFPDPVPTKRTKQTKKPFLFYDQQKNKAKTPQSGMRPEEIGGLVIGLLLALGVLLFVARRTYISRRKRKKIKKEVAKGDGSTKLTDLDPSLPQNEVDPFERVDMACGPLPSVPPPPYVETSQTHGGHHRPHPTEFNSKRGELPGGPNQNRCKQKPSYDKDTPAYNNVFQKPQAYRQGGRNVLSRTMSHAPPGTHRMESYAPPRNVVARGDEGLHGTSRTYPKVIPHRPQHERAIGNRPSAHYNNKPTESRWYRPEERSFQPPELPPKQRNMTQQNSRRSEWAKKLPSKSETRSRIDRLPSRVTNPERL